jgi:hypothetical protein
MLESPGVSRKAGALLLDLLDQQEPVLSAAALRDHFPAVGQELIEAGLLHTWGSEFADVVPDRADDQLVSVLPTDDGYGFFSEASGWVQVPADRLRRHRADIPLAIAVITKGLDRRRPSNPVTLAADDPGISAQRGFSNTDARRRYGSRGDLQTSGFKRSCSISLGAGLQHPSEWS